MWKQVQDRGSATTRASGDADMLGTGPVNHTHTHADSGDLAKVFPVAENNTIPPVFTPERGNYTCSTRNSRKDIGHIDPLWCQQTIDLTSWTNATRMVWARGDLFWYCGKIRPRLPIDWTGTCALVRLALPIILLRAPKNSITNNRLLQITPLTRKRRSTISDSFDFSSETYIDAIGVPMGGCQTITY